MIKAEELLDKIRSQNEVYNALKYQILTLKAERERCSVRTSYLLR